MFRRFGNLFFAIVLARRTRRRAKEALEFGRADLGIRWPVALHWRNGLKGLGQVSSGVKYQIEIRPRQAPGEAMRTVFHELYHLAQFHKWGDLHPKKRKIGPGDLERAESLAEIYARITAKSYERAEKRSKRGR